MNYRSSSLRKWLHPTCNHFLGFTLMDIMISIAILGALVGIATPMYLKHVDTARVLKVIKEIQDIETAIGVYQNDFETLPNSLNDINRQDMRDPWGNPHEYANHDLIPPGHRRKFHGTVPLNLDYDLFSPGPDGDWRAPLTASQSRDDIVRADDGRYIGLASQY